MILSYETIGMFVFIRNQLDSNKKIRKMFGFLFKNPRIYSIIISNIRRKTKEIRKKFGKENDKNFPDNFT